MSTDRPRVPGLPSLIGRPVAGALGLARSADQRARRVAADAVIAGIDAWLRSPELERIVTAVVEHEGTGRLIDLVIDSPAAERLVGRAVDHGLLDAALMRLLERDQLWILVDEVARSPAVAEAIAHQSRSAAGEVVDGVRSTSQQADAWLERLARRVTPGAGHRPTTGPRSGPGPDLTSDAEGESASEREIP